MSSPSFVGLRPDGLVDLDALCDSYRDLGLEPELEPGAQSRAARKYRGIGYSRGIKLFDVHHTAQSTGWTDRQSIDYLTYYAEYPVMANTYPWKTIPRKVQVMAAGPTYTAGSHPAHAPDIGTDEGNPTGWSGENPNNGVGEPWPEHLQETILLQRIAECLFFWPDDPSAVERVIAHYELTTRKIDPWGPSRWTNGANVQWAMGSFRADVTAGLDRAEPEPEPEPAPEPEPEPAEELTAMLFLISPAYPGANPYVDPVVAQYQSGAVYRATNAHTAYAAQNGIETIPLDSKEQYDDMLETHGISRAT